MNTRQFILCVVILVSVVLLAVAFIPGRLAVQPAEAANGQTILSISAAAFHPYLSTTPYNFTGAYLISDEPYALFAAPLSLPNGVTLNKFSFFWYDNNDGDEGSCVIEAVDLSTEGFPPEEYISEMIFSSGSAGSGFSETESFNYPVVDNARFLYYIDCTLYNDGEEHYTLLHGIQIAYSYATYAPMLKK